MSRLFPHLFPLKLYFPGGGEGRAPLPHKAAQESSPLGQGSAGSSWRGRGGSSQIACLSAADQAPPAELPALGSRRPRDRPGSHHARKSPLFWHPGAHSHPREKVGYHPRTQPLKSVGTKMLSKRGWTGREGTAGPDPEPALCDTCVAQEREGRLRQGSGLLPGHTAHCQGPP